MEEETFHTIILGSESVEYTAPEETDDEIPAGWTLQTEVQNDGSKKELYSCPGTGQQFYSHADFTRYVQYAKKNRVGIYAPCNKSVKRERHVKNNSTATKPRKTSVATLSLRRKPSSSRSNSLTAEKRSDSNLKSSSSIESTNEEKDEDDVPELDGDVAAEAEADGNDVDRLSEDIRSTT